jgi:hypothetical protein
MTAIYMNKCTCIHPNAQVILDTEEDEVTTGFRVWCDGCDLITVEISVNQNDAIYDWNQGIVIYNTKNESTDKVNNI